ncbi:pilus assembly protein PilP [Vibrio diazotrophicus]|uniref:pilus assembly protein PilP n=1 Tax=Vibrio diazotrophicus TaxID=685 RepID=UPI00142DA6D2|nr:pilus assembly protein PilP [Vibrio diazotrophicus]NIY92790.1 pilus assembly protein PilP [Vibrio diazotrophicus]
MSSKSFCWILICMGLVGCQANEDSLSDYIEQVTLQARKEIIPQQPIVPFKAFLYVNTKVREPFELPREAVTQNQPKAKKDCWQPTLRKQKDPLESFALSQLKFKGVMSNGKSTSALILTPEGKLAYVAKGQYIGINHGKVSEVTKQYLLIKETLPDGLGCWNQRSIKLALK